MLTSVLQIIFLIVNYRPYVQFLSMSFPSLQKLAFLQLDLLVLLLNGGPNVSVHVGSLVIGVDEFHEACEAIADGDSVLTKGENGSLSVYNQV